MTMIFFRDILGGGSFCGVRAYSVSKNRGRSFESPISKNTWSTSEGNDISTSLGNY